MKIIMTKQRKATLEKIKITSLSWGYGEHGGKEYFFTDGEPVSQNVVDGMLKVGLLKFRPSPLGGDDQEIIANA